MRASLLISPKAFPQQEATGGDFEFRSNALGIRHTPSLRAVCVRASGSWDWELYGECEAHVSGQISVCAPAGVAGKQARKWDWL